MGRMLQIAADGCIIITDEALTAAAALLPSMYNIIIDTAFAHLNDN